MVHRAWTWVVVVVTVLCASTGFADDREVLLDLDREFERATAEHGVDGWVRFFAENGSMLPSGDMPIVGLEAIRQAMAELNEGLVLRWKPERAEILIPDALGYTVGSYEQRVAGEDGGDVVSRGRYVTIWRKQEDGSWRVVFDTGE